MTKNEVKDLKLFGVEYDMFKCAKSRSEIAEEKLKKIQKEQGSNNTDKVSFKCIDTISKKITKIKISGKTATEITYMGNSIKYFLVTKKDGKYVYPCKNCLDLMFLYCNPAEKLLPHLPNPPCLPGASNTSSSL